MYILERADKENTLRAISSMIARSEQTQANFAIGTSQHSLQKNRIHALCVAQALVLHESGDTAPEYAPEDLELAKAPLASLISKSEKAQGKLKEGSWQYKMLQENISALNIAFKLLKACLMAVADANETSMRL